MGATEAEEFLKVRAVSSPSKVKLLTDYPQGTLSKDKNEILYSKFHMNYNNEPEINKKGSVVFRDVSYPFCNVVEFAANNC